MDDLDRFLDRNIAVLLGYLDGRRPTRQGEPGALEFVQRVLDEWWALPEPARRSAVRPGERGFWFALYTLEEAAELPAGGATGPYQGVLLGQLATLRPLLRERAPLPPGWHVTRPGEMPFDLADPASPGQA